MRLDKIKKIYKVKRLSDGLYSLGGYSPRFFKNGKAWNNLRALKSHFTVVKNYIAWQKERGYPNPNQWPYDDCIIEEFDVIITPSQTIDVKTFKGEN